MLSLEMEEKGSPVSSALGSLFGCCAVALCVCVCVCRQIPVQSTSISCFGCYLFPVCVFECESINRLEVGLLEICTNCCFTPRELCVCLPIQEMYSKGLIPVGVMKQVRLQGDNKFEVVTSLRVFIFRTEREGNKDPFLPPSSPPPPPPLFFPRLSSPPLSSFLSSFIPPPAPPPSPSLVRAPSHFWSLPPPLSALTMCAKHRGMTGK